MNLQSHLIPPHNIEAERALLGAILLDASILDDVLLLLDTQDFYLKNHQVLYSAIREMAQKHQIINLITVSDFLQTRGELEEIGGPAFLADVAQYAVSSVGSEVYVKIIREKSLLRQSIAAAQSIIESALKGHFESVEQFLDQAEEKFFRLSENKPRQNLAPASEIVQAALKKLEALAQNDSEITGISSGFEGLDRMTSGFQPGDLIIIAARPSMGKTAFSLNIAEHMTMVQKKTVAFFSLEMSRESILQRLIAMGSGVSMKNLRSGRVDEYTWPRIIEAACRLNDASLYINDNLSAITPLEIRAEARRLKSRKGLDCVIIDYLQLLKNRERSESREREVAEISRALKALAKELEIPVIALAQLNRLAENRTRPGLANLRESGSIEQDADLIMMLYREDYYQKENAENQGLTEIIIAKQRNGPTGTVHLQFNHEIGRFRDADPSVVSSVQLQSSASPPTDRFRRRELPNFAP